MNEIKLHLSLSLVSFLIELNWRVFLQHHCLKDCFYSSILLNNFMIFIKKTRCFNEKSLLGLEINLYFVSENFGFFQKSFTFQQWLNPIASNLPRVSKMHGSENNSLLKVIMRILITFYNPILNFHYAVLYTLADDGN